MNHHSHDDPNHLSVPVGIEMNAQLTDSVGVPGGIPMVSNMSGSMQMQPLGHPMQHIQQSRVVSVGSKLNKRELTEDEEEERREKRRRREKEKREAETPEEREQRTSKRRSRDSTRKEQIVGTEEWERRKTRRRENDKARREKLTPEMKEAHNAKRRAQDRARRDARTNGGSTIGATKPTIETMAIPSISVAPVVVNPAPQGLQMTMQLNSLNPPL